MKWVRPFLVRVLVDYSSTSPNIVTRPRPWLPTIAANDSAVVWPVRQVNTIFAALRIIELRSPPELIDATIQSHWDRMANFVTDGGWSRIRNCVERLFSVAYHSGSEATTGLRDVTRSLVVWKLQFVRRATTVRRSDALRRSGSMRSPIKTATFRSPTTELPLTSCSRAKTAAGDDFVGFTTFTAPIKSLASTKCCLIRTTQAQADSVRNQVSDFLAHSEPPATLLL